MVSQTYERNGNFATRVVGGEMIVVPIRSGVADLECVFTLDEVGAAIWRAVESPKTEEQILQSVLDQFDAEESDVRRDLGEFLATLDEAGLLRRLEAAP